MGDTAENFLGISAPIGSGKGTVTSAQRSSLDRNFLDEATGILEKADRIRTFREASRSKQAGQHVTGALSQLSPDQPDYLERRNQILARNPDAMLDKTALNFLGLQEDVFNLAEQKRREKEALRIDEDQFQRRLKIQGDEEDRRVRTYRERQLDLNALQLSSEPLSLYNKLTGEGVDREKAYQQAFSLEEEQETRLELLGMGRTNEEIEALRDPTTKKISREKLAKAKGEQSRREMEDAQRDDQTASLYKILDSLNDQMKVVKMDPQAKKPLQARIDQLNAAIQSLSPYKLSKGAGGAAAAAGPDLELMDE